MPFPVDFRGEVRWRNTTNWRGEHLQREVLHALATALGAVTSTAGVHGTGVTFTGGLFRFGSNVNILVPITYGNLEVTLVDDTVVTAYYINFNNYLVLTSVFALFTFGFSAASVEPFAWRLGFPACYGRRCSA